MRILIKWPWRFQMTRFLGVWCPRTFQGTFCPRRQRQIETVYISVHQLPWQALKSWHTFWATCGSWIVLRGPPLHFAFVFCKELYELQLQWKYLVCHCPVFREWGCKKQQDVVVQEATITCHSGKWGAMLQVMALVSVISWPIFAAYPV